MPDRIDADFLQACLKLRCSRLRAQGGFDNFDVDACTARGVWPAFVLIDGGPDFADWRSDWRWG
ncbi:hypothetical protein [Pseudomonas aeruginosa]|uniref:hypothetical protein n=1 Tax=Pseudomonas aeruginosa TaxID=287 RepID=UPI003D33C96E